MLLAGGIATLSLWSPQTLGAQEKKDEPPAKDVKQDPAKDDKPGKDDKPAKEIKFFSPINPVHPSGLEQINAINEVLEKGWRENKLRPSEPCTDYEFIRRASLDIIGRIATVEEIKEYMNWPDRSRRSMLIERLLGLGKDEWASEKNKKTHSRANYAQAYAENSANIWTVMLLTRSGVGKIYQEQMHAWLVEQFLEKTDSSGKVVQRPDAHPDWSRIATEIITAKGKTNENPAVNYILAHLGEEIPAQERDASGRYDFVPVTSRTSRVFLGLRIQCVQCHDHPFNGEWSQHHFWGINAFFRQTVPTGRPGMMAKKIKGITGQQFTLEEDRNLNVKGLVPYERRSGLLLYQDPTFLDGKKGDLNGSKTRREQLGEFVVKSPYFAKVFVNRMWGHFFGKSFTRDAPDDFGEHNPASYPELLDKLADEWANKYNHNPKDLIRWICNSKAYSLSSVANKTNEKPEDETLFSRVVLKSMTPEQLFDSLMTATLAKVGEDRDARRQLKEEWLRKLVANFGDDEGNEVTYNGTVIQALMLMNGQDINNAIMDPNVGTVAAVLRQRAFSANLARNAMRDLFLAALNRPPRDAEYARILNPKMYSLNTPTTPQAMWIGFYQDLFWALLNSNEFILNH